MRFTTIRPKKERAKEDKTMKYERVDYWKDEKFMTMLRHCVDWEGARGKGLVAGSIWRAKNETGLHFEFWTAGNITRADAKKIIVAFADLRYNYANSEGQGERFPSDDLLFYPQDLTSIYNVSANPNPNREGYDVFLEFFPSEVMDYIENQKKEAKQ